MPPGTSLLPPAPPHSLRGSPGKPHPRVFAFDDAPFRFSQATTPVVGVVVSLPGYLEGLLRTEVEVDGDDATEALLSSVNPSRFRPASQAILLGGISLAGFNVVDLDRLHQGTGLPVVTVTREPPDLEAMSGALERRFGAGAAERERRIRSFPLFPFGNGPRPLWVAGVGLDREGTRSLLAKSLVRGSYPEPLRLAHRIAALLAGGREVPRSRA